MADKTRASKSGIGYAVEKKMEDNYDREEQAGTPKHIVTWLNAHIQGEHDPCPYLNVWPIGLQFQVINDHSDHLGHFCETKPGDDWKTICNYLRDGVVLCKLINKLLKVDGKSPVTFQKKVASPFVAMTNVENFNKGCESYGVAKEFLFQTGDLWELRKGPFLNVINCLHSLGFVANSKNLMPAYTGEISKFIDRE